MGGSHISISSLSFIVVIIGRRRRMGRRACVAAAAVAVAWCAVSVMSHVLLSTSAARIPRDTHSWHTNSLSEVRQEEEEEERKEAAAAARGGQAASSRLQHQADNSPDHLLRSVVEAERLLLNEGSEDPEVTPGLFQGDIMGLAADLLPMNTRVALNWDKFPEYRWSNATVPYVISELYGSNERQMIHLALNTLDFLTCIKFVPWDEVATDYLLIWPMERPEGCWSFVGKKGGQQVLSLQAPDSLSKRCFYSLGKPIHELLHALGMFHEQARPDRDDHIEIITENIIPRFIQNFNKQSAINTSFPYSYDYNSVMHYGSNFFGYHKKILTIIPKVKGVTIGQRIMLSKLDCLKLNDLYGCLDNPFDKEKYTTFCTFLGH